MNSRRWNNLPWLLMLAVLLVGWLMGLYRLALESMWYDEWITWDFSRRGPIGLTLATIDDVHPPLYYLWVWVWMTFTHSQNLFVMRMTATIPALLTVALTFRLGAQWFRSHWAGLGAAAFLATSGIFIYYARELRMYTLVVLLAVLSWLLLWRYVTGRDRRPWWYALTVIAMAYTYYFTAFMVVVQALVVLLFYREKLLRLLTGYLAVGLALLPWIPAFLHQLELEGSRAGQEGNIGKFAATDPTTIQAIATFLNTYTAGQGAFVLLLAGLALFMGFSRPAWFRRGLVASLLWLLGTMALFFGVNLIIPVYNLRYVLMVIPALALIVGTLALYFTRPARIALIVLVCTGSLIFHSNAFLAPKLAHGELLPMIAERYQPGDRIWYNLDAGAMGSSMLLEAQYYLEEVVPELDTDWFIWDAPHDFANLEGNPRIWDVRPYWIPMPPEVEAPLLDGRALVSDELLRIYTIRLYAAPPQSQPALFGDLLATKISPLLKPDYSPDVPVKVITWWQALQPPPLDYSYGLFLRDSSGTVLAQVDDGLALDGRPTSQWEAETEFVPLELILTLPDRLPAGEYSLWLSLYFWQDAQPLSLQPAADQTSDGGLLELARITVE